MTHQDVIAALDYLGLSSDDLGLMVGESERRCDDWRSGAQTAPIWLDHLLLCWCEHPDLLAIAREDAELRRGQVHIVDEAVAQANATAAALNAAEPPKQSSLPGCWTMAGRDGHSTSVTASSAA